MEPKQKVLNGRDSIKVAIAQVSPVFLDREQSVEKAVKVLAEAASEGAELIAFPETWVAGYPYWGEGWESHLEEWIPVRTQFYDNALVIPSEETRRLEEAAEDHGIHVVMGCNEMDPRPETQTIYNTLLFVDRNRGVVGSHRKVMPTFVERAVWGNGDGSDLVTYQTDIGRIGGLICGEHLMTPIRAHMAQQGADFHVAVFPGAFSLQEGPKLEEANPRGDEFWGYALSRAHAIEAGSFVLSACGYMTEEDFPDDFPMMDSVNSDYARGGSSVISPLSTPLVGPESGDQILYATCEATMIKLMKAIVDTAGHYEREDIVSLDYHPSSDQSVQRLVEETPRSELRKIADQNQVEVEEIEGYVEMSSEKENPEDRSG